MMQTTTATQQTPEPRRPGCTETCRCSAVPVPTSSGSANAGVHFGTKTPIVLRNGGTRVEDPEATRHRRWNLPGTGLGETLVRDDAPAWNSIFDWDADALRYIRIDSLSPGHGQWLHCYDQEFLLPLANE